MKKDPSPQPQLRTEAAPDAPSRKVTLKDLDLATVAAEIVAGTVTGDIDETKDFTDAAYPVWCAKGFSMVASPAAEERRNLSRQTAANTIKSPVPKSVTEPVKKIAGAKKLSKATIKTLRAKFDDVSKEMTPADLAKLNQAEAQEHRKNFEPTVKFLLEVRKTAVKKKCKPSKSPAYLRWAAGPDSSDEGSESTGGEEGSEAGGFDTAEEESSEEESSEEESSEDKSSEEENGEEKGDDDPETSAGPDPEMSSTAYGSCFPAPSRARDHAPTHLPRRGSTIWELVGMQLEKLQ